MKEDFLHYIWVNKKFNFSELKTMDNQLIQIVNFGQYLQQSGPDIFNAQLIIDSQKWAGNVEIHVKSSDWYLHNHENDANYNNVILHVVWEHDTEVYRKDNSKIPVLQIKDYVTNDEVEKYKVLSTSKSWIFCENEIATVDDLLFSNWKERLFIERLEQKSIPIIKLLHENTSNWEATLFVMLAKSFGLNINGTSFFEMAKVIPYDIIKKESFNVENLEALFFGISNLLQEERQDVYYNDLQKRWLFLKQKYQLEKYFITPVQFFKLRPDNFPTIRLAQLAQLYHYKQTLFIEIILAKTKEEIYAIFNNTTSSYWETHYNFDKESKLKAKKITTSFVDLIIVNTIMPIKFLYACTMTNDNAEELIELISRLKPEKNAIVEKFNKFNIKANNAFDSQSLLQLKNEYCNHKKCLQCNVGLALLKK